MILNGKDRTKGSAQLLRPNLPSPARRAGRFLGIRLGLAVITMFMFAGTLTAQETAEEIRVVVTADRVLTDLVSTGANVSIITAEEIRSSGATNVVELLKRLAGVSFSSYSGEAQATVDIRGFGEGSQNRVLVLVDGRRQNNPDLSGINWLGIPLDTIERIEVVRGGASALYGNNAVSGVINVITKTPEYPFTITAGGAFGSFGEHQERLGLSLAGQRSRMEASAEHFSTDGHRDRSGYGALNFTLGAGYDFTPALTMDVTGRYGDISYEMPGSLTEDAFKDDPSQASNPEDEGTEKQIDLNADTKWSGGALVSLEIPLGYTARLVETDTVSWGSYTNSNLYTFTATPAVILNWEAGTIPVRSRLGVDWSGVQQKITSYASEDRDIENYTATLGQWTFASALSSTVYLTEQLDVSGALRYDRSENSAEKESTGIDDSTVHDALVFDLEAVYRPMEYAKLYLTGGTLFRYPALDEQASVQGFGDQFEDDLNPEHGFTVETGGGLYLGPLLQADLSAYWLEMRDEIAYVYDPATFSGSNRNIGETRRIGGDLQLSARPVDFIRITGGYSYVLATFTSGDNQGKKVPLVPNHSVDGEVAFRTGRVLGLEFGPSVSYRGTSYQGGDDANEQDVVPDYFLTNAFVRFRPAAIPEDLSINAEVKNIFDVQYAPLQYYSSFSDSTGYYPAPGRSFRISASYRY